MSIHLLKDDVINQIAAGEVIERPCSIVRELLDNSVDAQATEINVHILNGGQTLIRVEDNGLGLSKDDAILAFERHTTSKISTASDLLNIKSYGFRGEALASIAAVAKVVMRTRLASCQTGTEVTISAGKLLNVTSIACAKGTLIEVHNLFFNVPARKKFLKANSSEERKIKEWLKQFALANPTTKFSLQIDNKKSLLYAKETNLINRAKEIFSSAGIEVNSSPLAGIYLNGFLSHPSQNQHDSSGLTIIVNGRVVSDRMLVRAVKDGYGSMLKDREYPQGVLSVVLPPDMVDVNVHPQKSEVRFRAGREIFSAVQQSIKRALAGFSAEIYLNTQKSKAWTAVQNINSPISFYQSAQDCLHVAERSSEQATLTFTSNSQIEVAGMSDALDTKATNDFRYKSLRYLGQLFKCYLLCEHSDNFVIVDMHAAHERVRFNLLRATFKNKTAVAQQLLIPESVNLSYSAIEKITSEASMLEQFGFEIETLGDNALVIRAIPAVVSQFDCAGFIKDLASYETDIGIDGAFDRMVDYVAARIACHSSIRGGDILNSDYAYALFEQLDQTEHNTACPHGRPILISFESKTLEKWFGRQK